MDKLIIKDNETGNWMEIYHSENEIIIDTENDKAEIKGTFNNFEQLLIKNSKALDLEIQISEEAAFGKILKLINEKYKNLEIIYTIKYDENIVLDVIDDFSKCISKDTNFEIHCNGGIDWIAKVSGYIVYANVNGNTIFKDIKNDETSLHFISDIVTLSEINDLVDEFNDIQQTFGIISI